MDQKIIDLYDRFTHGGLNRREFLDRLAQIAGSSSAAMALLPLLTNDYARAAVVAPDDARLAIDTMSYDAPGARINGTLARLKSKGKRPAVIVIHENRGLNPHIQDVARRLAKAGYVALAVDLLSREGGTAQNDFDRIPGLLGNAPPARPVQDFQSGLAYAKAQSYARADRAGMVGFCYGGGVTWRVAAATP